jgi:SP family general alpha glucoside:H+ symporter-like MFS transporter
MLNPTGGNREFQSLSFCFRLVASLFLCTDDGLVGGKCGYVWGATALITWITAYYCLPEMKGRSYREIDIMFRRRIPARQFEKTVIGAEEDE